MPEAEPIASFDLFTTSAGGHGRRIVIEEAALGWESGKQSRRRSFDEITAVHLWADLHADGPVATCDITFTDGERLRLLVSDADFDPKKGTYTAYREFVLGLLRRLGPAQQARIDFREGPGVVRRVSSIIFSAIMLATCLIGMVIGVVSGGFGWEDNSWLLFPLLLLFTLLMAAVLIASLKSRDQTFDPNAVPTRALPIVPTPRRAR